MKAFIWKLRCAYHFQRIGCDWRSSWLCAESCYENASEFGDSPHDAFLEEIYYWHE